MKSWYSIKAKDDDKDEYEVHVYDEIGFWGITAKQFIDDFKKIPATAKIQLRINSPGGDVFDSIAIYNVIKRHQGPVAGTVDGLAASGASIIAMSAKTLSMPENTFLMIHNSSGFVWGNADDMREWADVLAKIDSSLIATYVAKSGQTAEKIAELMSDETWLTAKEAKDLGLADEVLDPVKLAALANPARFKNAPETLKSPPSPSPSPVEGEGKEKIIAATVESEKNRAKAIREACAKAGVIDVAMEWFEQGQTTDQVNARLSHAPAIRERCAAAKFPERASGYIKAGVTPEEVSDHLLQLKAAMDVGEINNKFGPNAQGAKTGVVIDYKDIYGRRRDWNQKSTASK